MDFHKAQPFRPFRIHLADGRDLDVVHPEFLARSPGGRTAVLFTADDHMEAFDLLLVTSLETINGKTRQRRSNGSGRKRNG